MPGITGASPEIVREPYRDAVGNVYHTLCVQPVINLSADQNTLRAFTGARGNEQSHMDSYVEEMFSTGDDNADRTVFANYAPRMPEWSASHYGRAGRPPTRYPRAQGLDI